MLSLSTSQFLPLLESLDIGDPVPCQAAAGSSKAVSNLPCGHHSALLFYRYIGDLRPTEIMVVSSQCILFHCAHTFPSSLKCDIANLKKIIRLYTTHLESLPEPEGKELRLLQLAQISTLLKESSTPLEIVGGLVGGDMNTISKLNCSCHKAAHIDLRDI
jgi:hypothetical protein